MTSYSTYATGRIRLVDGTLSPDDDERRDEEQWAIIHAIASGAARALLDTARDMTDPPDSIENTEVYAEQWHSAAEGWELDALTDGSRERLMETATAFVNEMLDDILCLATRIAWDDRFRQETFSHDQGMGIYRIGMLLGYELAHEGIGFLGYSISQEIFGPGVEANGRVYHGVTGRLSRWTDEHPEPSFEDAWIDSTEEPCLLHLAH